MTGRIKSVAIIGGGPAGAALGAMLARSGVGAVIFHTGKRPELIVGESLVPAVVPYLREMGVEDAVRKFSVYKPGATITLGRHGEVSFDFDKARGKIAPYAYNTPRDQFDRALLDGARARGAVVIEEAAELEAKGDRVSLAGKSAGAAADALGGAPDLIVDASGRSRRIPRLLDLPATEGGRKDIALFAHVDRTELTHEGHIHVDRHERGWGWRIPLPGRVSLGVVVDGKHLGEGTAEERLDRFIAEEPALRAFAAGSKRLTPVVQYTNYQLVSSRWSGPGWALLGDAAGFIDPIFSTGVYLALRGASRLAEAVRRGSPGAMAKYEAAHRSEIEVWKQIIGTWYDGRLFTLFRVGRDKRETRIGRFIDPHLTKHITRIFTGEAGQYSYSRKLLRFMVDHALMGYDPSELVIH